MVFMFGIALKFQKLSIKNNQIFFQIIKSPKKTRIERLRAWSGWGNKKAYNKVDSIISFLRKHKM